MSAPEQIWAFPLPSDIDNLNLTTATIIAHETMQHGGQGYVKYETYQEATKTAHAEGYAAGREAAMRETIKAIYEGKVKSGLADVKFDIAEDASPAQKVEEIWRMEMAILAGKTATLSFGDLSWRPSEAPDSEKGGAECE